jgi:flagellin
MIINHNLSAIDAHRQLKINNFYTQKNIEKLSSGLRINRAGDDAAGLAISEKMRAQIRGLHQASRNAQDGISFLQTAEGYLNQITMILQRLRELAVQSATGTYTNEDRYQIRVEVEELVHEVDRIASQAEFNTLRLLRGGFRKVGWQPFKDMQGNLSTSAGSGPQPSQGAQPPTPFPKLENTELAGDVHDVYYKPTDGADGDQGGLYVHIGPNMDQRVKVYIQNNSGISLGLRDAASVTDFKLDDDVSLLDQDGANRALKKLDAALFYVNRQRADIGGFQNRLEGVIKTVDYAAENLQSAESQIRDVDMAKEMVDFVKNQILAQSTSAMLVQANARPQLVMRILG